MGDLAGGVPGRARGQLRLLQQEARRPAFLGQVVEQAASHDAAADDDDPHASAVIQVLGDCNLPTALPEKMHPWILLDSIMGQFVPSSIMNDTIVPISEAMTDERRFGPPGEELEGMSPQLRKAAEYVIDNPNDVGAELDPRDRRSGGGEAQHPGADGPRRGLRGLRGLSSPLPRGATGRAARPFPTAHAGCNRSPRGAATAGLYSETAALPSPTSRRSLPAPRRLEN